MRAAAMEVRARQSRKPYQGVRQILTFNWPMYVRTAAGVCVALAAWPVEGAWARVATIPFVVMAVFWMAATIVVSHYVYDRSALYNFDWLPRALSAQPRQWINIHAGFDESSAPLREVLPGANGCVVDIFDERTMTEPSIGRARLRSGETSGAIDARFDALPFSDGRFDAAFLMFAAHELRMHEQRVRLFNEVARVLNAGGELVLMEHMRGGWNFAAFGPGALHFFSRRAWFKALNEAGFAAHSEFSRTPFVRVLILRKER